MLERVAGSRHVWIWKPEFPDPQSCYHRFLIPIIAQISARMYQRGKNQLCQITFNQALLSINCGLNTSSSSIYLI